MLYIKYVKYLWNKKNLLFIWWGRKHCNYTLWNISKIYLLSNFWPFSTFNWKLNEWKLEQYVFPMLFWWKYYRKGHWEKHLCRQGVKMANFFFILFWIILMICNSLLQTAWLGMLKWFLLCQGFLSQALTIHRTAGERQGPSFILPTHKHWGIYLLLCMWDDYHVFLIVTLVFTRLLLSEIYHLTKLPFDWLINDAIYVYLLDDMIPDFCYSNLAPETDGFELASTSFLRLPLAVNFFVKVPS